jgi:hypothetical protein
VLIHSVYYWLRDGLPADERDRFRAGLDTLAGISSVARGYVCACGPTRRPVIDSTYSWALILFFEDEAAHDRYQDDPVHEAFRRQFGDHFIRAVVYDCVGQGDHVRSRSVAPHM